MMKHMRLEHRFVKHIPDQLQPGLLYVSLDFCTAAHRCCCGCDSEVVTPISPTDWKLTFDGQAISLWPSIGNWNLRCRSHYVISDGGVYRAGPWSKAQVSAERRRDEAAKAQYYQMPPGSRYRPAGEVERAGGFWTRLAQKLFG